MDVRTRSVPERTLAVLGSEVAFEELEDFISSGFSTLFQWAERNPGVRALDTTLVEPTIVVFHAAMGPGESALVELCAVVANDAPAAPGIELRVEPAHEEAYVTLTKEGIEFPQILSAYEAVAAWVREHGEMIESMPTREVYFTDVLAAADDAEVCDIASPYVPR